MKPSECLVCHHPRQASLEAEVTRRGPRRDIPGRYGVTMAALRSHLAECLTPRSIAPSEEVSAESNPRMAPCEPHDDTARRASTPSSDDPDRADADWIVVGSDSHPTRWEFPPSDTGFTVTLQGNLTPEEMETITRNLEESEALRQRALVRQFRRAFEAMDRAHQQQELERLQQQAHVKGFVAEEDRGQ